MQTVKKSGNYLKIDGITVSMGNGKLDKSVLIFNLPAIKTCPNCKDCAGKCYAHKFEKLYPSVLPCRVKNYQESIKRDFVGNMILILDKAISYGVNAIRIHESGDFYSQEYADKWSYIASLFPKIKFFAYTKSPYRPDGKNINIVESILPDNSINFGNIEYIKEKRSLFGYPICPATIKEKAKKTVCGKNCKICQKKEHVLFNIH